MARFFISYQNKNKIIKDWPEYSIYPPYKVKNKNVNHTHEKNLGLVFILMLYYAANSQNLFNSEWQFHKGVCITEKKNSSNTIKWRTVNLPHDWGIKGPFSRNGQVLRDFAGRYRLV